MTQPETVAAVGLPKTLAAWRNLSAFDPLPRRNPRPLPEHEMQAWVVTVAARRAGHLRKLAQRLRARDILGLPPIGADLIRPIFRGLPLILPDWMAHCGSLVAPKLPNMSGRKNAGPRPDWADLEASGLPPATRGTRIESWATRKWAWVVASPELLAWASCHLPDVDVQLLCNYPAIWLRA